MDLHITSSEGIAYHLLAQLANDPTGCRWRADVEYIPDMGMPEQRLTVDVWLLSANEDPSHRWTLRLLPGTEDDDGDLTNSWIIDFDQVCAVEVPC